MNSTEILGNLHSFISKPILFAVFGVLCLVFAIVSLVLLFHWDKYALDKTTIITAQAIFFIGGAFILLIAFLSVLLY